MSQRQRILIAQQQRLALNASLSASIRFLRGDAAGLTRYLEEQVADNPHLRLVPPAQPALGDWLPRWSSVLQFGNATRAIDAAGVDPAAAAPSLMAHVMAGIDGLALPAPARRIAQVLAEALEPSGWIGRDMAALAHEAAASLPEVEAVLSRLQGLDPVGVFARNLSECLRLQAKEGGHLDPIMDRLLGNLELLAAGDTSRLARMCQCDESTIVTRFRLIRTLNPKPGADFSGPYPVTPREPDLLARALPGGRWQIALNRSALPDLEVLPDSADRDDSRDRRAEARTLAHMLKARNSTLLQVGREIARRQVAALIQGPGALVPMTMAEVGESLGLHESTISRVVNGSSMDSPRGMWWLRRMFSGARRSRSSPPDTDPQDDGAPGMAAAALRHRLGQLIAAESKAKPLSDQQLVGLLLQETGVEIARRTVAKYREDAGIPPRHRRRATLPKGPAQPRLRKAERVRGESLDAAGDSS